MTLIDLALSTKDYEWVNEIHSYTQETQNTNAEITNCHIVGNINDISNLNDFSKELKILMIKYKINNLTYTEDIKIEIDSNANLTIKGLQIELN